MNSRSQTLQLAILATLFASGCDTFRPAAVSGDSSNSAATDRDPTLCKADVAHTATPTFWLVVDGSVSMLEAFAQTTRWNALRAAVLDRSEGVLARHENDARWGLVLYDGVPVTSGPTPLEDGGTYTFRTPPAETCPRMFSIEAALGNYALIEQAYIDEPLGGSSPTHKALTALLDKLPLEAAERERTTIILATDAEPNDLCDSQGVGFLGFGSPASSALVGAVARAATLGVRTYVVSLAAEQTQALNDVAYAGLTGRPAFTASEESALSEALQEIVGPEPACDLQLPGVVAATEACSGNVRLGGELLPCDAADGWSVHDRSVLRLSGSACETYKTLKPTVEVELGCEAFVRR